MKLRDMVSHPGGICDYPIEAHRDMPLSKGVHIESFPLAFTVDVRACKWGDGEGPRCVALATLPLCESVGPHLYQYGETIEEAVSLLAIVMSNLRQHSREHLSERETELQQAFRELQEDMNET